MPPISDEVDNLGLRHRNLNKLVNDTFQKQVAFDLIKSQNENSDIDRLCKIDLASKYRNIDFIIENLKSDNTLYISRALKCVWLITDDEYSNIINPRYLYDELFPLMTLRAICKLKLSIRLNLRNEKRCEDFFLYIYENIDKEEAVKFLPKCSVSFIESQLQSLLKPEEIDLPLFKRLVEKSPNVAEIFLKDHSGHYLMIHLSAISFLASKNCVLYMGFIEKYSKQCSVYDSLKLGRKATSSIMKQHPERVMNNLSTYIQALNLDEFGNYLKSVEMKDLLVKLATMKELVDWFSLKNIKPLLRNIIGKERFELIRKLVALHNASKQKHDNLGASVRESAMDMEEDYVEGCTFSSNTPKVNISNLYEQYRYADFKTAFTDLKKLIRTEPTADERTAMMRVLISACHKNINNLRVFLSYFHDNHMNELKKFKQSVLRCILNEFEVQSLDDECWRLVNEMFYSIGVYEENEQVDDQFLEMILAYYISKHMMIDESLLDKFFDSKSSLEYLNKMSEKQLKRKMFSVIYDSWRIKVDKQSLDSEGSLLKVGLLLDKIFQAAKACEVFIGDFSYVVDLTKKALPKLVLLSDWDSSCLNNLDTKSKRLFFEEMLLLDQTEKVYIHMLKHNPTMIDKHSSEFDRILKEENVKYQRFLSKVRIYFPNTLAPCLYKTFEDKLSDCLTDSAGTKNVLYGLCLLSEKDTFVNIVQNYIPINYKIIWSGEDICVFNVRKYLASYMHLARPIVDIDLVLQFARDDYLQYALPSIMSICSLTSVSHCKEVIPKLINSSNISLQKQGIRTAFSRLPTSVLTELAKATWDTTKNKSIRAVLIKSSFKKMCKLYNEEQVTQTWNILKYFFQNLGIDEDRSIYPIMGKADQVPMCVRPEFCMYAYKCMQGIPDHINCVAIFDIIEIEIQNIMEKMDESFVREIIQQQSKRIVECDVIYKQSYYNLLTFISKYLITSTCLENSIQRYQDVCENIFMHMGKLWGLKNNDGVVIRESFIEFMQLTVIQMKIACLIDYGKSITYVQLLERIQKSFNTFIPIEQYYEYHTITLLAIDFFKLFHTDELKGLKDANEKQLNSVLGRLFAMKCSELLESHLSLMPYPCIQDAFQETAKTFILRYLQHYDETGFQLAFIEQLLVKPLKISSGLLAVHIMNYIQVVDDIKVKFEELNDKLNLAWQGSEVMFYRHLYTNDSLY